MSKCIYIYIYIYFILPLYWYTFIIKTAPVHLSHSHIQHLALETSTWTHTHSTHGFHCMHDSTHTPFYSVSSVSSQYAQHTHLFMFLFQHYIYISTSHIYNHSHFTRSVLSKQVQFISQHKHIIFLVLFCINIHILLPILLCTYTYIYIQQIMLISSPSKHLSTYILIMLSFYL